MLVVFEELLALFVELEDRYKAIPNLMAQRAYSIPDIVSIVNQLKNPKVRERFSCVVFDTMDKFEEMANRYIATNKEVEITEDIGFGKGKRYLNAQIGIITEIRNVFTEKRNIKTSKGYITTAQRNTGISIKER